MAAWQAVKENLQWMKKGIQLQTSQMSFFNGTDISPVRASSVYKLQFPILG